MMRRLQLLIAFLIAAFVLQAQAPAGYYDNANGLTGDQLKAALHDIIDNHTTITYAKIWEAFEDTDLKSNGKIWDMYSDIPNGTPPYEYTYGSNQCGSDGYNSEGDCYNREHSWPKSWFTGNENSVPGRDLHHIFPTDGYVNQQRGDNPFGEVQTASKTFQNGSKLGSCKSSLGYSGTVYEPIDEYKGDLARAYFYMSVRYYGEDSDWSSSGMTNKSEIEDWAMTMLLNWHNNDPVSQKEIDRNNVIYNSYQHNRNPFIDHPEYAGMIWNSEPIPDVFEGEFTPYTADIVEGDYIIIYNGHAMTNTVSNNRLTSTDVNTQNSVITNPSRSIVWHIAKQSNSIYWTIKNDAVNQYAAGKSDKNKMELISSVTDYAKWTPSKVTDGYEFENYGRSIASSDNNSKWMRSNQGANYGWAVYNDQTGGALTLYKYEPVVPAQVEYAYSINGVLGSPQQITQGESIASLPSGTNLSSDYTFAGWTDNLNDVENNIHDAGTSYQVNYDVVLYAVYAYQDGGTPTISYNKVTSAPSDWSGEYLIVCESENKVFNGAESGKFGTCSDVTINTTDYSIANTETIEGYVVNIASVTNGYTIQVSAGTYMNWTARDFSLGTPGKTYTIEFYSDNDKSVKIKYGDRWLQYNGGLRAYNSDQKKLQLYKKTTTTPTITTYYIQVRTLPTGNTELSSITTYDLITVPNGAVLTITGNSSSEVENLVVENGGQVRIADGVTGVKATIRRSAAGWTGSKDNTDGWHAISSPINDVAIAGFVKGGDNGHNVYRYVEKSNYWNEYRGEVNPSLGTIKFTNLTNGMGYLYRSTVSDIEFKGNVNVGNAAGEVSCNLSYENPNINFLGFNLLGNPFTHEITMDNLVFYNVYNDGYYILGEEEGALKGKWIVSTSTTKIAPMQAFLVQAKGGNPTVTINNTSTPSGGEKYVNDNIMFAVSNSQHSDEAYVKFKQGHGLNKIEHRNAEIPMLYVIDNDEHFAIADVDDNTNVINLGFEAKTMGQYTLSLKAEGDFRCLHLIDRITGEDIDMLIEDEYSFIAAPTDAKNRFVVKCRCNSAANADDEVFAYQNGDDMIVEGNGILQIFDVTGRIIANHNVNGVEIIGKPTHPGLYVFRLVGEDVKTQKIVVK